MKVLAYGDFSYFVGREVQGLRIERSTDLLCAAGDQHGGRQGGPGRLDREVEGDHQLAVPHLRRPVVHPR